MGLVKLGIVLILLSILIQDYRERQVYWFFFPLLLLLSGFLFFNGTLIELYLSSVLTNLFFLSMLLSVLWCYAKFRGGIPFKQLMGTGDILFFVILCFAFAPVSLLTLFVAGLLCALIMHLVLKTSKNETIPLAGYLSGFFLLVYLADWTGVISNL